MTSRSSTRLPIVAPDEAERQRYMEAKRDKMGHLLPAHAANGATLD